MALLGERILVPTVNSLEQQTNSLDSAIEPQAIRRAQVEMIYGQLPFIYLADIVSGSFLFIVFISQSASAWSYVWFGALISTTLSRALLANYHRSHSTDAAGITRRWWFLCIGAFSSGLIWGSAWLLFPAEPSFFQLAVLGLWLAGLEAGAAATMAIIKEVFIAFSAPASVLFVGYLLLQVDENKFLITGAYLMYVGFIVPIAFRTGRDFNRTIRLQIRNKILQVNLKAEAARLEDKEEELLAQRRHGKALQTEKENADKKLREAAEERLLLLDAVSEGIFGINNRGDVTFINASALSMLKLSESEVLNQSVYKLISSANQEMANNVGASVAIADCFEKGTLVHNMDGVFSGEQGLNLPVRFSSKPVEREGVVIGAVVSFSDISKQKEMEAMLFQSQKMEAIGRLTGGVSHDFNNLLTVIMGNLKFLQKGLGGDERASALINKIMNAAKSGADLNNRLLSFSREQTLETELVNVGELLLDMHEFLDRLLGEEIQLELALADKRSTIMIDRTQLENAILNLGVNAKDAMPDGGKLIISTDEVNLSRAYVLGNENTGEADFIDINVTDTGVGIPAEIQKQIFDPFFTTKEKHRGTGLGLSTVYGFIRQSGGNITVRSNPGEGTSFNLYLPVVDKKVEPKPKVIQPVIVSAQYEGTILVVEDDENVRDVAKKMLEDVGFDVLTANDGRAGLEQFKAHPDISLVFSDMIMPGGMTGLDMAEKIIEESPRTPILLATGYAEKAIKDKIEDFKGIICISKPYDTDELPKLIYALILGEVEPSSMALLEPET